MHKWGVIGLLLGLGLNVAAQLSAYHSFQATFHQGDATAAGYWAELWRQFSVIKLAASAGLGFVLGELYQQKAEQRQLVTELEAEARAKAGAGSAGAKPEKSHWIQRVIRMFNFIDRDV